VGYAASRVTEGISGEKTVTEAEWLACTDPTPMWDYLWEKGSNRKRQLFTCASCRRIWHLLTKQRSVFRHLVELAEQAADGLVTDQQLNDAWFGATGVSARWDYEATQQFATAAVTGQPYGDELDPAIPAVAVELKAQANLGLCILGNPFRPITISPAILAWHDSTVVRLAQAAYEERHLPEGTLDNSRLAVLADALEEAGCSSEEILGHLRGPGPHVRGCWPLDLCLGKS
jgi:hypothetical protein